MKQKPVKLRLIFFCCILLATTAAMAAYPEPPQEDASAQFETRCGWFSNPTPANISLYDRDAEWIIGVQGGYQVEKDWDWPDFKPRQWVRTNVNYGYGCACLQLRVDKQAHRVIEIKSSQAKPLSACRQDRALKKWKRMLD